MKSVNSRVLKRSVEEPSAAMLFEGSKPWKVLICADCYSQTLLTGARYDRWRAFGVVAQILLGGFVA
jgi:hypothetical protein